LLPLLWVHRDEGIAVLISEHRDGELIARVAESLGYRTIRGSTNRGGARALLEVVRELRKGGDVAITPDGPRGPAESFTPGAAVAILKSGAAFQALAAHSDRAWRLRSWDRFLIPKPFARVTVEYADPPSVPAGTDAELLSERLQALMRATSDAARE
jgi:lysophospholipid acyltransferase (LPLAT)-like uncharacterized protein